MFCPQCGAQNPETANFCMQCGTALKNGVSSSSPSYEYCQILVEIEYGAFGDRLRCYAEATGPSGIRKFGHSRWFGKVFGDYSKKELDQLTDGKEKLAKELLADGWEFLPPDESKVYKFRKRVT